LLSDVIGQMPSACVLVGDSFTVLQSNAAARKLFGKTETDQIEFADLPQELGSKIFTALKSGAAPEPYKHQFMTALGCIYRITISPLHTLHSPIANTALVLIENITRDENAKRLEIEASNLRLVKSMAEHLAHEIGNSLVPLSTHQQLLEDEFDDAEFRTSLSKAMSDSVRRISRLSSQMMFLAREKPDLSRKVNLDKLIVEAFQEAHAFQPATSAKLEYKSKNREAWMVTGDAKALKHALSEVMLNALQANPENPNVEVQVTERANGSGAAKLDIEVRDMGSGFTAETAEKASEPFFSTRTIGLGLGLTVTRKIIESHNGRMEIAASEKGDAGIVRITLPFGLEQ
jgi:nitrogen fixation/metabolism regulation signal transduction histidine kinase